jgi:hypothetical protein
MPEDPKPAAEPPKVEGAEPAEPATPEDKQPEEDVGDFINRHVFEKDSVFFEG